MNPLDEKLFFIDNEMVGCYIALFIKGKIFFRIKKNSM
jgi:hypothetical protein